MTVMALDVGGSTVRGRTTDASGALIDEDVVATGDRDPGLAVLHSVARRLSAASSDHGEPVRAIGLGMPEYVTPAGLLTSTEVLDWTTQPADLLRDVAPLVAVDSDVRCSARAELQLDPTLREAVVVSVGTGISHAVIQDGRVVLGHRGEAIGLGQVPAGDPRSGVGPTVEAVASGAGMRSRYEARTGQALDDGAREVLRRSEDGDADAGRVVQEAVDTLAYALWLLVKILDPDRLVLTGGLGAASGPWHDRLHTAYESRARDRAGAARIEISRFGDRAGLAGAELLAREALENQERR